MSAWVAALPYTSAPHAELLARGTAMAGSSAAEAVGLAYPPIPTVLAFIFGTAFALSAVASLFAATALHATVERMVRRRLPWYAVGALTLAVVAPPASWYLATQDLATMGGLTMLVIALDGVVRFAFGEETEGGFTAGLLLAGAFLFDPVALVYVVLLALAAPLLAWSRHRGEPAAARATIAVLCAPTLALVASTAYLRWLFTGRPIAGPIRELGLFSFPDGVMNSLVDALAFTGEAMWHSPIYLVVGTLLVLRRPVAGLGLLLPLVGLTLTVWVGFPYAPIAAILLLTLLGLATIPSRPGWRVSALLVAAAAVQLAVNLTYEIPGWNGLFA